MNGLGGTGSDRASVSSAIRRATAQNNRICASTTLPDLDHGVRRSAAVRVKSDRPLLTEREAEVNGDQWPYDPRSRRRTPGAVNRHHLNTQRRPLGVLDG
jgi:hypothetical protein